jgi:hypothetical protein
MDWSFNSKDTTFMALSLLDMLLYLYRGSQKALVRDYTVTFSMWPLIKILAQDRHIVNGIGNQSCQLQIAE